MQEIWKVSLHGGHSGEFCDHGEGTLRDRLEEAATWGYHTFGVTEHSPRHAERFLYDEERRRGWTLEKSINDFLNYAQALQPMVDEFADRLVVLRGFEAEVVPTDTYIELMLNYRNSLRQDGVPAFDYMVGSVHYVEEITIDGTKENFQKALELCGGLENLAIRYYELVAQMSLVLKPEVIGHLDLVKLNAYRIGYKPEDLATPRIQNAVKSTLEAIHSIGGILDLNTAGWRKGLGEPYPSPWLVKLANQMEVGFCFGDDSHRTSEVGFGVERAKQYLLENGVTTITTLTREGAVGSRLAKVVIPLQ